MNNLIASIMKRQFLYILLFISGSFSCSDSYERSGFVDPNEELLTGLSEVDGYDHTYNYDFKILQFREKVDYYIPVSFSEGLSRIPAEMREKITLISQSDLPFTTALQECNIVTSWNANNQLVFQIQFSYLENDEGYDTNFKDFFIISVTQYPEDPFADEEVRTEYEEDLLLRKYEFLSLPDNHPLYYLAKSKDNSWPRMFDYYNYVEDEKRIYKESTGSYQYYAWYNGLIYKIGCNMDIEAANPETLVRKIILGN